MSIYRSNTWRRLDAVVRVYKHNAGTSQGKSIPDGGVRFGGCTEFPYISPEPLWPRAPAFDKTS